VEFLFEQALVSTADADDLMLTDGGCPDHGTHTGIHSRRISATTKHSDSHRRLLHAGFLAERLRRFPRLTPGPAM
jgi:hypothetical protein